MENFIKNSKSLNFPSNIFPVLFEQDKWPFKENSLNCIINNLCFHNVEDLESHLNLLKYSLKPDGCILANFFGSHTLNELKFVMNLAEEEREGGVSTNVFTFPTVPEMGNLLHKINLTLPSLGINRYIFKFDHLVSLCEFLEMIGESNALKNKRPFKRRDTFIAAISLYQNLFNQNRLTNEDIVDFRTIMVDMRSQKSSSDYIFATFEVGSVICWKYHESQQKPKERGSAEFSLKELASDVLEKEMDEIRYGSLSPKAGSEDEYEIVEMTEIIKNKIRKKLGEETINKKLQDMESNKTKS
jgi:NADH dehydrogenase [ubiquinone] 1 alpha subcomplex assembly factor 5